MREIVVQPQRGLIVDDVGRPLVANRTSWVVSVDRTMLDKMPASASAGARQAARRGGRPAPGQRIRRKLVTCGEDGQRRRHLLERLALPARAGGDRRRAEPGAAHPRAARGLPGGPGRAAERARLPPALRRQPRPRAGLPQPDHRATSTTRPATTATGRSTAPRRWVARASRRSTTRWLRGMPGYQPRRRRLDGPSARRRQRDPRSARRHAGHLDRRQGAGRGRAAARRHDQARPAPPATP